VSKGLKLLTQVIQDEQLLYTYTHFTLLPCLTLLILTTLIFDVSLKPGLNPLLPSLN